MKSRQLAFLVNPGSCGVAVLTVPLVAAPLVAAPLVAELVMAELVLASLSSSASVFAESAQAFCVSSSAVTIKNEYLANVKETPVS